MMAVYLQYRQLLLVPILLLLASDSAFGRFFSSPAEQHHRFKRDIEDIFLIRASTWTIVGWGVCAYLAFATFCYIGTFCCALEKKCAAATAPQPSVSSTSLAGVSVVASSASTRTAKSPSQASMSTALQESIRIDSRTQRETERAATASRKSVKVPPSTRLPTASAKEQTASKKTTSTRTSSKKSESKGTSSKKTTSKGTTDTGKSTSTSARSTSGGSESKSASSVMSETSSGASSSSHEGTTSGGS